MNIVVGKPFEHHTKLATEAQHVTVDADVTDQVGLHLGDGKLVRVFYTIDRGWVIESAEPITLEIKPVEQMTAVSLKLSDLHKRLHGA